ncbi:MAG: DUF371 domain-containing protein [Nitrosopumilaceae archaeon]
MKFQIKFAGHKNIRSLHPKTIEITKESHLTTQGDCIVGVSATCGCKDIPNNLKKKLKDPNSVINFSIGVKDYSFKFSAKGHKNLVLSHVDDIVIRKSNFVCPRTLAVGCDKASDSIPRKIIKLLQDPKAKGVLTIDVQ